MFGNSSAASFTTISSQPKNSIRSPVNLSYEVLRDNPFRVKILWDDDNKVTLSSNDIDAEQRLLELNLKTANLSAEQETFIENLLTDPNLQKIDLNAALAPFNLKKEQLQALQAQVSAIGLVTRPVRFQLQRRDLIRASFSTFPLTENQFIIDEVPSTDAIPFESKLIDATYVPLSNSAPG